MSLDDITPAGELGAVQCASCDARYVVSVAGHGEWAGQSARREAVVLAALRSGWLYYHPTGAWSCVACVAKSDHSGAEYRSAARRMVETIRRAVGL